MAVDGGELETLSPSRFLSFSFPNLDADSSRLPFSYSDSLRVAVLDSPSCLSDDDNPRVAALLVPKGREHDWIFSTLYGHLQLLNGSPGASRLILVGNPPLPLSSHAYIYTRRPSDDAYLSRFQRLLLPILLALSPKAVFKHGIPQIPFLLYEDNLLRSMVLDVCTGPVVGEMLIEDVEIEDGNGRLTERRRRLRFKRMPNLVQTQFQLCSLNGNRNSWDSFEWSGEADFRPQMEVLVQPYLQPMVASLSLIASYLDDSIRSGSRPRILCLGVGGGALLSFLRTHFTSFNILGVEIDETVLAVAKRYFGLVEDECLRVCVGDGIDLVENFSQRALCWNAVYDMGQLPPRRCSQAAEFSGYEMVDVEARQCHDNVGGVEYESIKNLEHGCNPVCVGSNADLGECGSGDFHFGKMGNVEKGKFLTGIEVMNNVDCTLGDFNCSDTVSMEARRIAGENADYVDFLVDVIMVDLDSSDATSGLSAPPLQFIEKSVLLAARSILHKHGLFAVNVIWTSEPFYAAIVHAFREVFSEVYEIDVGNGENYVLIATASPVGLVKIEESAVLNKLKGIIDGVYIDRLRKI